MKVDTLKLKNEKIEVILLGINNRTKHLPSVSLHIDDISLESMDKVKNLWVVIDNNLYMSLLISLSLSLSLLMTFL